MTRRLVWIGAVSVPIYGCALLYGAFQPNWIGPFLAIFGLLFVLYAVAVREVLCNGGNLSVILGFAILFNLILLPSQPTLSDDMYRYVWDGRVQAAGINPYRYPPNATELKALRDDTIWRQVNRPHAVTVYPPGAQIVFALLWRLVPNSILITKLGMVGNVFLCGGLLMALLKTLGQSPSRVLIFLWNPLLVFEIAHSAHVDALYLPLIVGAMLVRARSQRVNMRHEILIGILLGLGTLVKLYPVFLAPALWSLRDSSGGRRWRLALPIALCVTVIVGYMLYFQPGVNVLGYLGNYAHEYFNISPLMRLLTHWAWLFNIDYWIPGNLGMPLLVAAASVLFILFPARTPRDAILRCFWPIGIYLLINHNLYPWYVLWLLPLITIALQLHPFHLNGALAWWVFTGLIALAYTYYLRGEEVEWAIQLQFLPLYALLLFAGHAYIPRLLQVRYTTATRIHQAMKGIDDAPYEFDSAQAGTHGGGKAARARPDKNPADAATER